MLPQPSHAHLLTNPPLSQPPLTTRHSINELSLTRMFVGTTGSILRFNVSFCLAIYHFHPRKWTCYKCFFLADFISGPPSKCQIYTGQATGSLQMPPPPPGNSQPSPAPIGGCNYDLNLEVHGTVREPYPPPPSVTPPPPTCDFWHR